MFNLRQGSSNCSLQAKSSPSYIFLYLEGTMSHKSKTRTSPSTPRACHLARSHAALLFRQVVKDKLEASLLATTEHLTVES